MLSHVSLPECKLGAGWTGVALAMTIWMAGQALSSVRAGGGGWNVPCSSLRATSRHKAVPVVGGGGLVLFTYAVFINEFLKTFAADSGLFNTQNIVQSAVGQYGAGIIHHGHPGYAGKIRLHQANTMAGSSFLYPAVLNKQLEQLFTGNGGKR